jgi:hypothetical protein
VDIGGIGCRKSSVPAEQHAGAPELLALVFLPTIVEERSAPPAIARGE